jgi:hypothetical protein
MNEWISFEQGLAAALSILKDEETLILSSRTGHRFVQFLACREKGVFSETVSNGYLGPAEKLTDAQVASLLALSWVAPTHAPDSPAPVHMPKGSPNFFREFPNPVSTEAIARIAVQTLADVHHIPDPAALTYRAFDLAGRDILLPALQIDRAGEPPRKPRKVRSPIQRLRARVLTLAREAVGDLSLAFDKEGDLAVRIGSRPGFIRIREEPTVVRVYTRLARPEHPDEDLLALLHRMNARMTLARLVLADGSIFLAVDLPGAPFQPVHLTQAMLGMAAIADDVAHDLAEVIDGERPALAN